MSQASSAILPPPVSVVMPVYNALPYLREAVDSILNQTFSNFEFVIIDDGSTDGSTELLQGYAKRDERVRLFSRPNQGIGPTRNEGWHRARGDLVAIMDADDVAVPTRLEKQVAFMNAHPETVCVSSFVQFVDPKGRRIPCPLIPPVGNDEIVALLLKGACPISNSAAMVRRQSVEQVGGYDEDLSMAEDYALWLKLSEVGRLENIPEYLVNYRIHEGSVSEQKTELQLARARMAWERALTRRGITGVFEQTANWRAGPSRSSQHEFALRYGWWAFNGGERSTAIAFGLKAVKLIPFKGSSWRLLICSIVKQMPQVVSAK